MSIDQRAVVDPGARIGERVSVGPYSVIGPDVEIGDDTRIGPHVVIMGPTQLGRENRVFQFASLGAEPQDKKYSGEPTRLVIGDRNTIREFATINRGTSQGGGLTRIGDDNWLMAYIHIAHDCVVGNNTVFSNGASLAGHVTVEDHAILGGFTLVHQFCRIGAYAFCGMGSGIAKDVPPFVMVNGNPAQPHGLNAEGMRRRGFSAQTSQALRRAYKVIYRSGLTLEQAQETLREMAQEYAEVGLLAEFIAASERSIVR